MSDSMWPQLVEVLQDRGLPFEPGLLDAEVQRVEADYGFHFPPDLRSLLQAGLPVGDRFPNWRREPPESLRQRLAIPLDGVLFDVEHNGFWLPDWGLRPEALEEARTIVRGRVAAAPTLIPVYGHRMMPDQPATEGNPVFSVHQTDIIY